MSSVGSNRHVVVVSGDTLPLPGLPTTGAGLRAWGLGEGLLSRGHAVTYLMPAASLKQIRSPLDPRIYHIQVFDSEAPDGLDRALRDLQPEVIVFQHWFSVRYLSDQNRIPTVIDFHGPMMLETLYEDMPNYDWLRASKIVNMTKADLFTCAGEYQRHYFYPWLIWSGFDVRDDVIKVIPVSMSPQLPVRDSLYETVNFVYGGVFLPWQDPSLALETLTQTLEDRNAGRLQIFGGLHLYVGVPPGKYRELIPRLQTSPRVEIAGMVPHDDLVATYLRSHVAMDVMARNPERELAFTTRTVEYLWCGLPVIYGNYAELSNPIRDYDAGWIVDPENAESIRQTIESILDDPAMVRQKSINAQKLAREKFTWDRTIEPLDQFCRQPYKRSSSKLKPIVGQHELVESREAFAGRAWQDLRRIRRGWNARLLALAREAGRRMLKRRYSLKLYGHQVTVTEPLLPHRKEGQAFKAYADKLAAIGVAIGTFGRINTCDLVLQISNTKDSATILASVRVNAMLLADSDFCYFNFPPIEHSSDRDFYFWLESPDAVPGDCVVLFRKIADGSLLFSQQYENQKP